MGYVKRIVLGGSGSGMVFFGVWSKYGVLGAWIWRCLAFREEVLANFSTTTISTPYIKSIPLCNMEENDKMNTWEAASPLVG